MIRCPRCVAPIEKHRRGDCEIPPTQNCGREVEEAGDGRQRAIVFAEPPNSQIPATLSDAYGVRGPTNPPLK